MHRRLINEDLAKVDYVRRQTRYICAMEELCTTNVPLELYNVMTFLSREVNEIRRSMGNHRTTPSALSIQPVIES
ncbi:hypothetical protein J6590_077108 [Homalodisca vitripennis]|nr:hypothetical protein J6590_077108 [Homalodisca vitripennis]